MQKPILTSFDPLNPQTILGHERPTAHLLDLLRGYAAPRCTVVDPDPKGWGELLVWLPHATNEELRALAKKLPEPVNHHSADFLKNRSMLCFEATGIEIRINLWELNNRLLSTGDEPGFCVAFMNQTLGLYAEHLFSPADMEDYVAGLQGSMISSGPNYNPVRVWGDTFLDEHEGKQEVLEPGVLILPCLTWSPAKT